MNIGIHLVGAGRPDNSNEQQVDLEELTRVTYVGNSRIVIDLVFMNGSYVAIEHIDDGDGPLLEND